VQTRVPVEGITVYVFLDFDIRQYLVGQTKTGKPGKGIPLGFTTRIKPTKAAQHTHLHQMHEEVRHRRASSQAGLIHRRNPIIRGWSNYYATVAAKRTFVR